MPTKVAPATSGPKVKLTKLFIDNKWVEPVDGGEFETFNPTTGEVIAKVAAGGPADVDKAVKAARRALETGPWSTMDAADRGRLLFKLADLVEQNAGELAALESLNCGKTITDSKGDMEGVVNTLRYYAGWADKIEGRTVPVRGSFLSYTLRQPVGVVGQIIPWNFPLMMLAWKWGPALACGNTVVLKPAEQTPLSAVRIAELAQEAGFPGRSHQHRQRPGRDHRRGPRGPSGCRQDRLHRARRHGEDHPEGRRRHAQAHDLRAGRQEPQRHLRRRQSRGGRARGVPRDLLPRRPVLHGRKQPAVLSSQKVSRRIRRTFGREAAKGRVESAIRSTPRPSKGPQVFARAASWTRFSITSS